MDARHDISNPQRIVRVLQRTCQANLTVLVRVPSQPAVAVKGKAMSVDLDGQLPLFHIGDISIKGTQFLSGNRRVQIEFAMVSAKVVFICDVQTLEQGKMAVHIPRTISNIERRQNIRYPIPLDLPAFIITSLLKQPQRSEAVPPVFPYNQDLGSYVRLVDISQTGLCGVTRFPAIVQSMIEGTIDQRSQLVLPLEKPIHTELEIRWTKRLRTSETNSPFSARSYRFGALFVSPSEEFQLTIRQYIQRVAQLNAI